MSRFPERLAALAAAALLAAPALAEGARFGLGRVATEAEIAAWDTDIRPDGQGLPEGSGDAYAGEEVFADQCAVCHGDFGEGVDRWPVLAGGQGTLTHERPVKTIGSYWPYASTVFDYIWRAMPFGYAQSLEPDDVYAITAYLLYMNDVITEDDFVVSHENLAGIRLPNAEGFYMDDRPDTPTVSEIEPCMRDCKPAVEITMRARILDVTPEGDGEDAGLSVE
jgi:cytochrome c